MIAILQTQIEYLARTFILTVDELENLKINLDKMITQIVIEELFSAEKKRALANAIIKPAVVSVIKQRPALSYNLKSIEDACNELVT